MDKLIKASDAVDIVAKHSALYGDGEVSTDDGEALLYDIMSEIMNLPSAQPDVPDTNVGDMISRQAVIDFINGITNMDLKAKGSLVLGIKFMPAVKQEPCNDAVSRKALLHIFEEQCYPVHYDHNSVDVGMTLPGIVEVLNIAPSAQPERCEDCENFGKTRLLIPQPEIIHCENCKNWQTGWRNREWGLGYHWCSCVDGIRRSDWFCADAERRTDETD